MPLHDWSGVPAGLFHHFHQVWSVSMARLLASYETGSVQSAYIETVSVGSPLPAMPLFIAPGTHVLTPLESTYQEAWQDTPESVRRLVAGASNSG